MESGINEFLSRTTCKFISGFSPAWRVRRFARINANVARQKA
jgi:hypothetical protein